MASRKRKKVQFQQIEIAYLGSNYYVYGLDLNGRVWYKKGSRGKWIPDDGETAEAGEDEE